MQKDPLVVVQIDHVELFVPDRREAAAWYERVLGLHVVPEFEFWEKDSGGPLMISTPNAGTKLALFQGKPQEKRKTAGFHRVAFRVGAEAFVAFARRAAELELKDRGQPIGTDSVADHDKAFSIYFDDPYGHHLEVTTYDYEKAKEQLAAR